MNEKVKYVCIGIVLLIVGYGVYWFMLRDVHDDGSGAAAVTSELGQATTEQHNATESARRVGDGLDDSISRVGNLEDANRNAQNTVTAVGESNNRAESAINSAKARESEYRRILEENQRIIIKSQQQLQGISERTGTAAK